jgi:hypothetical protein
MASRAYYFAKKIIWLNSFLLITTVLAGCVSMTKGVTLALLEKSEETDTRRCEVWGKPFEGIEPRLAKEKGKTRILMVHGVGDHIPGYATQFQAKLAKEMGLNARSASPKNIELQNPVFPGRELGNLRVSRLANKENGKEVLFYELTWSVITRKEKELLAYDISGEYDYRRAAFNAMLKKFSNDAMSDPLMYAGTNRELIQAAFGQSFCWMLKDDWDDLPASGGHACLELTDAAADRVINDDHIFISHSLGSRITTDGLQRIAGILPRQEQFLLERGAEHVKMSISPKIIEAFRPKRIPIFMMSNQLPMLQLGREPPEVVGQEADYCRPDGRHYNQRMVSETSIIAFSDPNDLLSFGIPPGFRERFLDSRVCADITNISINVAPIIDAFGMTLARPGSAHIGYDKDERVVALIAKGIGTSHTSPLVMERCEYTPTIE